MVRYLPGEPEAIETVKRLGALYGYGNLISHLQTAYAETMSREWGLTQQASDYAAGIICAWCHTDKRTGKKVKREHRRRSKSKKIGLNA